MIGVIISENDDNCGLPVTLHINSRESVWLKSLAEYDYVENVSQFHANGN